MEYCNPDKEKFQNYVWDTQSLNQLATDDEMIEQCKQAIASGHRYYITSVQKRKLGGVPDRKMNYQDASAWKNLKVGHLQLWISLVFCGFLAFRFFIKTFGY